MAILSGTGYVSKYFVNYIHAYEFTNNVTTTGQFNFHDCAFIDIVLTLHYHVWLNWCFDAFVLL